MIKACLLLIVFSIGCFGQIKKIEKNDAELAGLKGKVQKIIVDRDFGDEFDQNGYLKHKSLYPSGNCFVYFDFTTSSFDRRTVKKVINDFSNSANCTVQLRAEKEFLQIPQKELRNSAGQTFFYDEPTITYDLTYSSSDDPTSGMKKYTGFTKTKFIEETARGGKMIAWRKIYIFDESLRLIEETRIEYDLRLFTTRYFYDSKYEFPASAEILHDNILVNKVRFEYENIDKKGNWLKRTRNISIIGIDRPMKHIEERRIVYY
jgi:hypothetical protein